MDVPAIAATIAGAALGAVAASWAIDRLFGRLAKAPRYEFRSVAVPGLTKLGDCSVQGVAVRFEGELKLTELRVVNPNAAPLPGLTLRCPQAAFAVMDETSVDGPIRTSATGDGALPSLPGKGMIRVLVATDGAGEPNLHPLVVDASGRPLRAKVWR
ncbi:hypothetical protein [Aurantimonas sp. Leaf443]|uniref:hypothetical protein n=1 Tax=Aurantimonas sp. Leaf443 TaxID=1736378 RepID=UPI000700F5EB|nr:hypothetical protein [Aurantimonas sp. Leaf443]KQT85860.1 hypothetical protein ASG48_04415 [Aurantimonas sp. Leaf443]